MQIQDGDDGAVSPRRIRAGPVAMHGTARTSPGEKLTEEQLWAGTRTAEPGAQAQVHPQVCPPALLLDASSDNMLDASAEMLLFGESPILRSPSAPPTSPAIAGAISDGGCRYGALCAYESEMRGRWIAGAIHRAQPRAPSTARLLAHGATPPHVSAVVQQDRFACGRRTTFAHCERMPYLCIAMCIHVWSAAPLLSV